MNLVNIPTGWHPTPVFLPGESQGRRSLVGCSPWGRTESDTTEETQQQQEYESASIGEHSCQHLILSNFCFEGPFNFSHSSGTTVISHWILNSIFLVTEHLFILDFFLLML